MRNRMAAGDIEYGKLLQAALRTVVRTVLVRTERDGLPGDHHFYISLRLDHPGTEAPPFVRQRHPEEMTIVLQHQFWDLAVDDAGFGVTLRFDGMPARLRVPWDAVVAFFDPTAEFGLRFDLPALAGAAGGASPSGAATGSAGEGPARPTVVPAAKPASAVDAPPTLTAADETPTRPHEVRAPDDGASTTDGNAKVLTFERPRDRKEPEDESS